MSGGGACPALDDDVFSMTSSNVTAGTEVNVSCRAFGHRVVGSKSLKCSDVTSQWDPDLPTCEWTWEFTTQEKVVLGTAVGCAALIILVAIVTITAFCICRRRRHEKHREYNDADNAGYEDGTPGDTGGIYPDAYFAYQDVGNKHDMNGLPGTMDRAWLGYIPRPKVAEGPYYH